MSNNSEITGTYAEHIVQKLDIYMREFIVTSTTITNTLNPQPPITTWVKSACETSNQHCNSQTHTQEEEKEQNHPNIIKPCLD
jgi:hypothetical protein